MGGMKISELDFVRLLPVFMRDDEAVIALSNAINDLLGEPGKRLHTIRAWDKIDELTEEECDELAWELDIDWYASAEMSLEEKRETIKVAQQIKRKRGTKWAVERLIDIHLGDGYIAEWFELDNAKPYTFMILTTNEEITAESYEKFVKAADIAKNERSHIAGIFYFWQQGVGSSIEYALDYDSVQYDFTKCGTVHRAATVGLLVKPDSVEAAPEVSRYLYRFPECGAEGYKAKVGAAVVGTAIVGKAVATN